MSLGSRGTERFATAPVVAIASLVVGVLVALAGRYGYHRDELYFLAAGRHLAWGYPDQPPLVPLIARACSAIAPGSVAVLRIPSALAAGGIVVVTALTAREFGANRCAQTLAAWAMATGAVLLGSGHLLSTATFNFLAWSTLLWLVVRTLRIGDDRLWLPVGVTAGLGLLASNLVAFLMAALVIGMLLTDRRTTLRSPWLWAAGAVAVAAWSPYLSWQAGHGWPQLAVSRSIAAGHSGSSQPRALFLPEQLVLLSPYLSPLLIIGLFRLLRDPGLRWCRAVGISYLLLAGAFVITGGKAYYLAGMFPVLLGAGAQPVINWMRRGPSRWRRRAIATGIVLSAAGSALVTLPVLPIGLVHHTPIVSVNYDIGETVGWPSFVAEIAAAQRQVPGADGRDVAVIASNYGEAGAVDRYGRSMRLPGPYGVHNGYWYWGPPPVTATRALAVGFTGRELARFCASWSLVTRLDNHRQVHNDEQGAPVWFCSRTRSSWKVLWPRLRVIG